jgi:hypothetical protein
MCQEIGERAEEGKGNTAKSGFSFQIIKLAAARKIRRRWKPGTMVIPGERRRKGTASIQTAPGRTTRIIFRND